MSDTNTKCLDLFPKWLQSIGDDVGVVVKALKSDAIDNEARRFLLGGINYLFKSLDLIPDGIDDIGYLGRDLTFALTFLWHIRLPPNRAYTDPYKIPSCLCGNFTIFLATLPTTLTTLHDGCQGVLQGKTIAEV